MNPLFRNSSILFKPLALAALVVFAAAMPALAGDKTWKGTTSTGWNTTTNWNEGAVPVNNDRIVFNNLSTANLNTSNDVGTLTGLSILVPRDILECCV
jgi:hypothetical protein